MTTLHRLTTFIAEVAMPWLRLLVRLRLAQAVTVSGAMTMAGGADGVAGGVWLLPAGTMLALGVLTRPVAGSVLLAAVATPMALPWSTAQGSWVWAALLADLVVFGAGPISMDRLLQHGLENSAVPGAPMALRAFRGLTRWLGPVWLPVLRGWAAASVLLPALGLSLTAGLARAMPPMPPVMAQVPSAVGLGLAGLLLLGSGTRVSAVTLLLLSVLGGAPTQAAWPWMLLLSLVAANGPGPLSVDGLLHWRGRRMVAPRRPAEQLPHVVIVGGGFGGIAAAQGLKGVACRVTLIDRRNHHVFQPLLYQVATAGLSPGDVATPIRGILRDQANAEVRLGAVVGVDREARGVRLERGSVPFDVLVLATGARHGYLGHDEWADVAPGLKSIEDSTSIRGRLLLAFEEAELAEDVAERAALMTFVIVGGGPTGVELAGAIAELARQGLARDFRRADPAMARVILVQSAERLLPTFPDSLSKEALRKLEELEVEVLLGQRVEAMSDAGITVAGREVAARTVLWAAGVKASPAAAWLGVEPDRAGRVPVEADLSVPGWADVFAVGDTAASDGWRGKPVPGLAPAAKQGGAYVARVVRARIAGARVPGPFRYRHWGSLATIGRQAAVADFGVVRLRGTLAWWLWGFAHIAFLVGGRNRILVAVQWFWAYLSLRRETRLITESR